MSEPRIVVHMDLSSWNQIKDDIGNYWGIDPDETEVFESVREIAPQTTEREDQLRQLVSYCRSAADGNRSETDLEASGAHTAYGDVADKLAAILDGES